MTDTGESVEQRELVITRTFDAPRELVFAAWTTPEHVAKWWGPRDFTITTREMDIRPGGVWRYIMHGPDGVDYDNEITYLEIERPERLVYRHGSGGEDPGGEFQTTVTFAARAGQTELTMQMLFASVADLKQAVEQFGAIEGANQTLDSLAEFLADRR